MKILVVAGLTDVQPKDNDFEAVVAVDAGAIWALDHDFQPDIVVGDFDSVSDEEMIRIVESGAEVHKLTPIKDETDLEVALFLTFENYPDAKVTVIGALGGRLDHELTNIYLPTTKKFQQFARQITLENLQNTVKYLQAGENKLDRITEKKYIGFMKVGAENFSIENAKYPLKAEDNFANIYASNEFISDNMTVKFSSGCVIVIYSCDVNGK
ncbi:MAG: thiamine diphosphokinase [Streptococcaceae bacterium]|jgi:thiamine pyrophosphokinase|nr:thiamine diphosphokinase [Streptococcaceae bacterium]